MGKFQFCKFTLSCFYAKIMEKIYELLRCEAAFAIRVRNTGEEMQNESTYV